jgi:hypothetical protein
MKHRKLPDLVFLEELFNYDPITGKLLDSMTGDEVGWINKQGYRIVRVKKKQYKAHRICFYMFHKRDPLKKVVDHIDGDKSNNAIVNLRAVTHRQNLANTSKARATKPRPANEPGAWKVWAMPV